MSITRTSVIEDHVLQERIQRMAVKYYLVEASASCENFNAAHANKPKHSGSPLPTHVNPPVIPHEHRPQLGFCRSPAG